HRARARRARGPPRVERRALHVARSPRNQRTSSLEARRGHAGARWYRPPLVHGHARRLDGLAGLPRGAATHVAGAGWPAEGTAVVTDRTPPRLARWLLRRTLPPGARGDTIAGDLL